jgi:hypothetical protein
MTMSQFANDTLAGLIDALVLKERVDILGHLYRQHIS